METLKKVNNMPFRKLYNLSFILISFLIALDPKGDWVTVDKITLTGPFREMFYIQNTVLILLIITNAFLILNIIIKKALILPKELMILILSLFSSCIIGYLNDANNLDLIVESSSYFFLPIQIILFLNNRDYIYKNLFKYCYFTILFTTIIKILIYFEMMGSLELLFSPGSLKLCSIFLCHSLGMIYCLVNNRYKSYKYNISLILCSLSIGLLSTQRTSFLLILVFLFYLILKYIFSEKKFYKNFIVTIIILFISLGVIINTDTRFNVNDLSANIKGASFYKRYDTFICFIKMPKRDLIFGTGIGTPIKCSQEGILDSNKFLRRNQTELGLFTLFIKIGLINTGIFVLFFNKWLKNNISKNHEISNSIRSTLLFICAISLIKTTVISIYNLYFILILILWNLSEQNLYNDKKYLKN